MLHVQLSSNTQLGLDTRFGLNTQASLDEQPGSDLLQKLHVLVYSFSTHQDAEISLQATCYKLIHLYATDALKLHVFQRFGATSES